ncbi:uncharacterized protein LOC114272060 [Camellia sinensis]|uniref:uncharacterized protein LOC114272060 n=1 Tax=Camellia sinensis TaxID=4442 RepID=UPI001035962E|nr:uncharacterized protein LOC114272060 [Camellia sinensis]
MPKDKGGLGVRRLVLFNLDLLGKWLWRFVEKRERLWRRVVVAKFGVGRGSGAQDGWVILMVVGCGKGFGWVGRHSGGEELSLEFRFPLVFAIATNSKVLVGVVRVEQRQLMVWNVQLRRDVQDWELDQLVDLLSFLYGLHLGWTDQDSLVWDCPRAKGIFIVSSFYGALVQDKYVFDVTMVYLWKSVWVPGTPSKVAFFVWTVSLGRILTIDNLICRGHILVNWCCLCGRPAESVDHLLIHCSVSSRLWMLVVAIFEMVWVQSSSVFAILKSWVGGRVGRRRRKAWILALHCLLWLIWLERNRQVFHGVAHSIPWLERRLLTVLYSWVTGLIDPDVLAFTDFVKNLIC